MKDRERWLSLIVAENGANSATAGLIDFTKAKDFFFMLH